jgi:hypothetical protein
MIKVLRCNFFSFVFRVPASSGMLLLVCSLLITPLGIMAEYSDLKQSLISQSSIPAVIIHSHGSDRLKVINAGSPVFSVLSCVIALFLTAVYRFIPGYKSTFRKKFSFARFSTATFF